MVGGVALVRFGAMPRRLPFASIAVSALLLLGGCGGSGSLEPDPEPTTPECPTVYPDVDGEGLGDDRSPITTCDPPAGYVEEGGDAEPECASNDTDDCGVCGGGDADKDCDGVCFGSAFVDGCGDCVGGATGDLPAASEDWDSDGRPDVCDQCPATPQDRFIVQWDAVPPFDGGGGPYTFSAELFEDGDVLLRYGSMQPFEASATVGAQDLAGAVGVTAGHDDTFAADHGAVRLAWSDEDGTYGVEPIDASGFAFNSVEQVGTSHVLGDDASTEVGLPFGFPLFGDATEAVRISSNGFLAFGEGELPGYDNTELPTGEGPGLVAVLWDDLNPGVGGSIYSHHVPADACERDCTGTWGGFAELDGCGVCAGGTTGVVAGANLDCAGVCDGSAFLDECGLCVGGTTGLDPSDPEACPNLPDFTPDPDYLAATLAVDYVDVADDSCLVAEGCVNGLGVRKVIRFGTRVGNVGTADFVLGVPPGPGHHWDACHEHYHYEDYADYQLLDALTGLPATKGHKNGFCLLDSGVFDPDIAEEYGSSCGFYTCSNQGIGAGCHDTYGPGLACQWIDVTGVDDGTYQITVTLNPDGNIAELDPSNNTATATVEMVGDEVSYIGP